MTRFAWLGAALFVAAVAPGTTLAQAVKAAGTPAAEELVLRPGDVIQVRVWPDSALGGSFPVEETGIAYVPIVGEIQASGRTVVELRQELRERYSTAMKAPIVTVTPVFRVSVMGAVVRPGLYNVDPSFTIYDVISLAGGFAPSADIEDLRIVREGRVIRLDASAALERGIGMGGLALHSGDWIVVPEKGSFLSWQTFSYLTQVVTLVFTILTFSR